MPLQFLLELAGLLLIFSGVSSLLARAGRPVNRFAKVIILFVASFLYLRFRVYPPMPFSLLATYLVLSLIGILLWASSSEQYWQEFRLPIVAILDGETGFTRLIRGAFLAFFPVLGWFLTWNAMILKIEAPIELRTIHPAPPITTRVHGKTIDIQNTRNPYRVDSSGQYNASLEKQYAGANTFGENATPYLRSVREGGQIYFQECVLCHGASLSGGGMFGIAFEPHPVSFTSFFQVLRPGYGDLFFRTAKGWTELPREGFPWASTMPPMEQHLSSDNIWKVTLFLYWYVGLEPYWEIEDHQIE